MPWTCLNLFSAIINVVDLPQLFSATILQYTQRGSGGNVQALPSSRDAPLRTTQISRSPKDPARAWEGLNVAPAPSLRILQDYEKQRQHDENQPKYA